METINEAAFNRRALRTCRRCTRVVKSPSLLVDIYSDYCWLRLLHIFFYGDSRSYIKLIKFFIKTMEKEKGKKKGFFSTLLRRKSTGGGQGAKAKAAAAGGGGGAGPAAAGGGGGGGDEAGPVGRLPSADDVGAAAAGEGAGPADDLKVRIHTRLRAHSSAAYSHKIHLAMQHRRTRVSASGDRERPVQSSRIMRRLRPIGYGRTHDERTLYAQLFCLAVSLVCNQHRVPIRALDCEELSPGVHMSVYQ